VEDYWSLILIYLSIKTSSLAKKLIFSIKLIQEKDVLHLDWVRFEQQGTSFNNETEEVKNDLDWFSPDEGVVQCPDSDFQCNKGKKSVFETDWHERETGRQARERERERKGEGGRVRERERVRESERESEREREFEREWKRKSERERWNIPRQKDKIDRQRNKHEDVETHKQTDKRDT
jgi:hypothetical protein